MAHQVQPQAVPADELNRLRQEMVQTLLDNAAVWRRLSWFREDDTVFVDNDQRLLWRVPGVGLVCMQVNPNTGAPMVMESCGYTEEQLAQAHIVFNLYNSPHVWQRLCLKPTRYGDYCELAAKGSESAAEYLKQLMEESHG